MMKRLITGIIALMIVAQASVAQDAGGRYVAERKSSFDVGGKLRNPFWPVGFVPSDKVVVKKKEQIVEIPPGAVRISSILLANPPLVVINDGEFTTGDVVPLDIGGRRVQAKLLQIADGYIRIRIDKRDFRIPYLR